MLIFTTKYFFNCSVKINTKVVIIKLVAVKAWKIESTTNVKSQFRFQESIYFLDFKTLKLPLYENKYTVEGS